MARSRTTFNTFEDQTLVSWAEVLGEALGRGVARGLNAGLSNTPKWNGAKLIGGPRNTRASGRSCKFAGCGKPPRALGLCSAHYQSERRRTLARKARA